MPPGEIHIHRLKIAKSTLSIHSTRLAWGQVLGQVSQIAAVTIISYKPLPDFNFAIGIYTTSVWQLHIIIMS